MNKKFRPFSLVLSTLVLVVVLGFASCSKSDDKNDNPNPPQPHEPWSPDPENGELPESVLPAELVDVVGEYFTIYGGDDPAPVVGQFVSSPHALIATSVDPTYVFPDSVEVYNDRYICFERTSNGLVNFYGKQWDNEYNAFYEEVYRDLNSVGSGDNFTCYYLTEGYPNGMYALQSTIFSGIWNDTLGGLKDFQVAVILLETSGNPNLYPVNSYRILGDFDGLAENNNWMGREATTDKDMTAPEHDAFWMFRRK